MSKKNHEEKALAVAEPPEPKPLAIFDVGNDLEQFKDEFDKTALQIPFLRILQANSPTCTPGEPNYNEDARPGLFFNTVSGMLCKKIEVIPVYHYSTLIEWKPRTAGGGYVRDHGFEEGMKLLPSCTKRMGDDGKATNRDVLPNGNDLIRTEVYFVLTMDQDGSLNQAMITMTSTQLKKSRNWNSRIRMKVTDVPGKGKIAGCPMFFNTYVLSTAPEKNDTGNWMGYVIDDGRSIFEAGPAAYQAAKSFRETCEAAVRAGAIALDKATEERATKEEAPF
jgi:hypothetical protein